MTYITINKKKYLIRGNFTSKELRELYKQFVEKYKSKLTLEQWVVQRGKVYFQIR